MFAVSRDMTRPLLTSVGSFPVMEDTSVQRSIELFCDLQRDLRFDVFTDGEPRNDMIGYFLSGIEGLGVLRGRPSITGRVRSPQDIDAFSKIVDLKYLERCIHLRGIEGTAKVALTGPITLGFTCALGNLGPYSSIRDPRLYQDTSSALLPIVQRVQKLGAITQIDEPGLSAGFMEPASSTKYLQVITGELKQPKTIVHVCGRITPNLSRALLSLENVDTLSLAFASQPENVKVITRQQLLSSRKNIAAGCARVDVAEIGDTDKANEIALTIEAVKTSFGQELISYVHPDCGLRRTPLEIAKTILANVSIATSTAQ